MNFMFVDLINMAVVYLGLISVLKYGSKIFRLYLHIKTSGVQIEHSVT